MELNKEEIIKAFECCHTLSSDCLSCPFLEDSKACAAVSLSALALIKKLNEENEILKGLYEHNSKLAIDAEHKLVQCKKDYEAELHRVHMLLMGAWESVEVKDKLLGTIKADTVKKMHKAIKETAFNPNNKFDFIYDEIDRIAKELLEEKNDV